HTVVTDESTQGGEALVAACTAADAGLRWGGWLRAGCSLRGSEAERDGREGGKRGREGEYPPIHAEIEEDLAVRGADEGDKKTADGKGQEQSAKRASRSQEKTLGQKFANHSSARGAESETDGDLVVTGAGAGQHQVCEVRARNQENKP